MSEEQIDLSEVRDLLRTAMAKIEELHDTKLPAVPRGRDRGRDRAAVLGPVQKDLLFLGHLLDKARILTLDEYHVTRGYVEHLPADDA